MKSPLNYQVSDYDCVPTTFLNALNYLFNREEIPPIIIHEIITRSLDNGSCGTSKKAIQSICDYLNSKTHRLPIQCDFIKGKEVNFNTNLNLHKCLHEGNVIACRVSLSGERAHYVLITNILEKHVELFDPYFRKRSFGDQEIQIFNDPFKNRSLSLQRLNQRNTDIYALGPVAEREAVIIKRLNKNF